MGEMGKVYRGEISPDAIRPPPPRMEQPNPSQQQPTPPLQQQPPQMSQTSQAPKQDSFNNEQNYRAAQTNRGFRSQSPANQGWYNPGNQSFSNQQNHFYPSPPSPTNRGQNGVPPPMRENTHSYTNGDSLVWNQPSAKQQVPPPPTRKAFDRSMSEPGWNNVRRESYSPEQPSWNRQQDNYYQPIYDLPEPWIKAEKHFDHLIEHGFVPASDMKSARKLS